MMKTPEVNLWLLTSTHARTNARTHTSLGDKLSWKPGQRGNMSNDIHSYAEEGWVAR